MATARPNPPTSLQEKGSLSLKWPADGPAGGTWTRMHVVGFIGHEMSGNHIPKTSKLFEILTHFGSGGFEPFQAVPSCCPILQHFIDVVETVRSNLQSLSQEVRMHYLGQCVS